MRFLIDARPLVDPIQGGVSRVARGIVDAFVKHREDDEIVLATTGNTNPVGAGLSRPPLFPLPGYEGRWGGRDKPAPTHIHIRIPNKLWSAACMAGLTSFDRAVEKRAGKIDAIFLPNIGFVGRIAMRPYVLLLHDLSFLIEPRWFSLKSRLWHKAIQAKRCIQNAAHLLAVSETTKRDAMRLLDIPEERITVIPVGFTLSVVAHGNAPSLGIGVSPYAPTPNRYSLDRGGRDKPAPTQGGRDKPAPTQNRYILALGGKDRRKNSMTAVRAIDTLRREKDFSDIELILVGAGLSRPPRIELYGEHHDTEGWRDKPAPTWIHHIQHPYDSELASLYSNASVFLYPSWYEGYGLPLHEAAAFGIPRVASTSGALPETAPHGTIFADPAKPHHWVEAIKIALSSPRPDAISSDPEAWNKAAAILSKTLDFIAK